MTASPDAPLRVLVTGGTGYLGHAVAQECRRRRIRAVCLSRRASLADGFAADVRDASALGPACEGADAIIHCAGLAHEAGRRATTTNLFRTNTVGTRNVVIAARDAGVRCVVLLSSVAVYGEAAVEPLIDESAACEPMGAYAVSKLLAEHEARAHSSPGMTLVVLRMATVYGGRDPGNVGRLIAALDSGRFVLLGDGENRKSLIHLDDAARASVDALGLCPQRDAYNVVGHVQSLATTVRAIAAALGRRRIRKLPGALGNVAQTATRLGGIALPKLRQLDDALRALSRDAAYDGSAFERAASFEPKVSHDDGIEGAVAAYRGRL